MFNFVSSSVSQFHLSVNNLPPPLFFFHLKLKNTLLNTSFVSLYIFQIPLGITCPQGKWVIDGDVREVNPC